MRRRDLVMNIIKGGVLGSFQHFTMENQGSTVEETEHAYVNVLTRGDLSSLRWIISPLKYAAKKSGECNYLLGTRGIWGVWGHDS